MLLTPVGVAHSQWTLMAQVDGRRTRTCQRHARHFRQSDSRITHRVPFVPRLDLCGVDFDLGDSGCSTILPSCLAGQNWAESTGLGKRMVPRLRELAHRGQR